MAISRQRLNEQFMPAGRRFNCEGYPEFIANRVRAGVVHKPAASELRRGAIVRGGGNGIMLRNVIAIEDSEVTYGWWIPICEEDLSTPPATSSQLAGRCTVDDFLKWSCDILNAAPE